MILVAKGCAISYGTELTGIMVAQPAFIARANVTLYENRRKSVPVRYVHLDRVRAGAYLDKLALAVFLTVKADVSVAVYITYKIACIAFKILFEFNRRVRCGNLPYGRDMHTVLLPFLMYIHGVENFIISKMPDPIA
jgi:hypothetical protein